MARRALGPRTAEWHLRQVFTKLEIRSRQQLARAVPSDDMRPEGRTIPPADSGK
jgi:DNA-binding NarL/FixJ family response regulator